MTRVVEFQEEVLSWDYYNTSQTPRYIAPQYRRKLTGSISTAVARDPLPSTFDSVTSYIKHFEPLLRLECWAGIQNTKKQLSPKDAFKVQLDPKEHAKGHTEGCIWRGSQVVEVEVSATVFASLELGPSDLLLVTFYPSTITPPRPPQKTPKNYKYAMAVIINTDKNPGGFSVKLLLKINLPFDSNTRLEERDNPLLYGSWHAIKLTRYEIYLVFLIF